VVVLTREVGTKAATGVPKTKRSVGQRDFYEKVKDYYKMQSIYRPGKGHMAQGG